MMKEMILIGIIGNNFPIYTVCPKDGLEIITHKLDRLNIKYEINPNILRKIEENLEAIPIFIDKDLKSIEKPIIEAILPDKKYSFKLFGNSWEKNSNYKINYKSPYKENQKIYGKTNQYIHNHKHSRICAEGLKTRINNLEKKKVKIANESLFKESFNKKIKSKRFMKRHHLSSNSLKYKEVKWN